MQASVSNCSVVAPSIGQLSTSTVWIKKKLRHIIPYLSVHIILIQNIYRCTRDLHVSIMVIYPVKKTTIFQKSVDIQQSLLYMFTIVDMSRSCLDDLYHRTSHHFVGPRAPSRKELASRRRWRNCPQAPSLARSNLIQIDLSAWIHEKNGFKTDSDP